MVFSFQWAESFRSRCQKLLDIGAGAGTKTFRYLEKEAEPEPEI